MATISDLASLTSVVGTDLLIVRRSTTDYKITANLAAWVNNINTFTRSVIVAPSTLSDYAFSANMEAGTSGRAYRWQYNGALRGYINTFADENSITLSGFDNGAGLGCFVSIQRNSNATTPAAGFLYLQPKTVNTRRVWVDDSGQLRIHTADPTNANDAAGTVVGTQTSSLDTKDVQGGPEDELAVLEHIREGAAAVRRFVYKNGAYNGDEFSGIVIDYAPRYGMDRDAEHPAGKSLNVINAIGDLMIAVSHLASRVEALENK